MLKRLANDVAEIKGRSRGAKASETFGADRGEDILSIFPSTGGEVVLIASSGRGKKLTRESLAELSSGRPVMKLEAKEQIVAAFEDLPGAELVCVTSDAQVLRTGLDGISTQGPGAKGVTVMKLKGNAAVIGAGAAESSSLVFVTSDQGTHKVTELDEVPAKGQRTGGVRLTKFKGEQKLTYCWVGKPDQAICIVGQPEAPTKAANKPESLTLRPTKRDAAMKETKHRVLAVGTMRW